MWKWRLSASLCAQATALKLFAIFWLLISASLGAATITSFSPTSGQPGNVITINGTGLSGTTLVQFDADSATDADFIIISDTELQTVVPLGATTGPFNLTVSGATVASAASFTVAPAIASFTPGSGQAGTPVTIFGANFISGSTMVQFTGVAAVAGSVTSASEVTAVVPAGATNGPITVTTSAGSSVSTNGFTVSTAPVVTDFSPTIGTNLTSVVINGANFASGSTVVQFNGKASLAVTVSSTTQLHAIVPSGATTGPISVTVGSQTFTTASNFTTASALVVTGFEPSIAQIGASVNLAGVGLNAATGVTFSNGVAASITGQSDGQLQVVVPSGAKTGPIKVSYSGGSFNTVSNFQVLTGPLISSFSPTIGPVGTAVVIHGVNFTGATAVKFNGVNATSFSAPADTQITAYVPSGGTGPISVFTSSSSSTTSSNFLVTTAAPYVEGFSPASAVRGQAVTINGANFANLLTGAVRFAGVAASNAPVTATTQLTAYVPAGADTGAISVSNAAGGSVSAGPIYLQPWITNFTPVKGWVYSNLTVSGRNFAAAQSMNVNGVRYNFSGTPTNLVAAVPTNAEAGLLKITTPGGVIISTNSFVILPKIFGFSPLIGPRNTILTLTGTSLSNVTEVEFGGLNAVAAPLSASFGLLTVKVPTNAQTGPLTVVTPAGTDTTTSNLLVTQGTQVILTKTANVQTALPGQNVTYSLFLTNLGVSIMTGVVVTDSLPTGLSFVSGSSSFGALTHSNSLLTWQMPPLTNQTAARATIVALATNSGALNNVAGLNFAEEGFSGGFFVATSAVYFATSNDQVLRVSRVSTNLLVAWPDSGANFQLQSSTNLDSPTNWRTIGGQPAIIAATNYVTNRFSSPREFFRLKAP